MLLITLRLKPLTTLNVFSLLWTYSLSSVNLLTRPYNELLTDVYDKGGTYFPTWFHGEGRNTETLIGVLSYYFQKKEFLSHPFKVSIEFEKWGRERAGLAELLSWSDVVFFSETWATGAVQAAKEEATSKGQSQNHPIILDEKDTLDVKFFANLVIPAMKSSATGYLTVGAAGVYVLTQTQPDQFPNNCHTISIKDWYIVHIPAITLLESEIVETTGAGDTFIGAIIYGLGLKKWDPIKASLVAVKAAGRKCTQAGFEGLGHEHAGFGTDELDEYEIPQNESQVTRLDSVGPEPKRLEGLL